MKRENKCSKKASIGGQAVIEGIMMKGPKRTVLAVRTPDNSIVVEDVKSVSITERFSFLKAPFLRGVVNFVEAMIVGYRTLMRSADLSGMTDLEDDDDKKKKKDSLKEDVAVNETEQSEANEADSTNEKGSEKASDLLMSIVMVIATVLGVALAVFLFMWFPSFLFDLLKKATVEAIEPYRALIEGIMKIIIFILYITAVSQTKDIKRIFMYHGSEHKTIFCYENGLELTVENVRKQSRFHPRCGTSFMFLMIAVGIVISTLVGFAFPVVKTVRALWVTIKIILIPLFCSIGYELIRFCGRHDNLFTRIVSAPGLLIQRLTTKEPDDQMIEVAIESIKAVLPEETNEQICN